MEEDGVLQYQHFIYIVTKFQLSNLPPSPFQLTAESGVQLVNNIANTNIGENKRAPLQLPHFPHIWRGFSPITLPIAWKFS